MRDQWIHGSLFVFRPCLRFVTCRLHCRLSVSFSEVQGSINGNVTCHQMSIPSGLHSVFIVFLDIQEIAVSNAHIIMHNVAMQVRAAAW